MREGEEDSHLDADIESADELEEEEDLNLDLEDDEDETATQASSLSLASTKKSPIRRRLKVCVYKYVKWRKRGGRGWLVLYRLGWAEKEGVAPLCF